MRVSLTAHRVWPEPQIRCLEWAAATILAVVLLLTVFVYWHQQQLNRAFYSAAARGDIHAVTQLLAQGASVQYQPKTGDYTALGIATHRGHTQMVRLLLAHGARPNVTMGDDWTPLIDASSHGSHEIVRALLSAGAEVNTCNQSGETPLDLARKYRFPGWRRTVELLTAAGAKSRAGNSSHTANTNH